MNKDDINIRLDGLNILEKVLLPSTYQEGQEFIFDIKSQLLPTPKVDIVATVVSVSIRKANEEKIIARIICEFGFEIKESKSILEKDVDGKMIIPVDMENFIKTISISTMRGIMYSEFRGTPIHNATLPIIIMDSMKPIPGNVLGVENAPPIVE